MLGTGSRIFIVEHDMDTLSSIYMTLLHRNYLLEASADAYEIHPRVERFRPDLILINQDLPGFDGPSVCRYIKEVFQIPIILIVKKDAPRDLVAQCPSDDIIEKPVNTDLLLAKINILLAVE